MGAKLWSAMEMEAKSKCRVKVEGRKRKVKEYIFLEGHGNRGVRRQTRSEKARAQLLKDGGRKKKDLERSREGPETHVSRHKQRGIQPVKKCKG